MKIIKSILGILSFMVFLMGIIYGGITGIYISTLSFFLMLFFFNIVNIIEKKTNIELNLPSNILLIGSLLFIYLSFYEENITVYNIIMSIFCTILSWLFIFYLNIPKQKPNIIKIRNLKIKKYSNYKTPPISLLNQDKITYTEDNYQKQITSFFKSFNLKLTYVDELQNSWLLTYKYEIESGIKIDDILELKTDLELKLQTKVEINISEDERNIIYIKIPRKDISNYGIINDAKVSTKSLIFPLGEDDDGNKININLEESGHILLLGESGCGKTNYLNIIINTILLNYMPTDLDLILIDKHQTGFDIYNNIPHLVLPVLNNPNKLLDYLDIINEEINRRNQEKDNNTPLLILIDEIFDTDIDLELIKEELEPLIMFGKKENVYLIISTSIMQKNILMDYLYNRIKSHIYFYERNIEEYNTYKQYLTTMPGIINTNINNKQIRIRIPKINDNEIENIVNNAKGLK